MNGVVYAGFGGHCDHPPYLGWVVGVSTAGSIKSMWADETGQNSGGAAGIWQSGGAPVVDASGALYFITGNGTTPPAGPALGSSQPRGLGQCVIKLNTATGGQNGTLSVADWFCPNNAAELNSYDGDFGSGGPVALPASFQSAQDNFPLLVAAGKEGVVYLLDMDDLGGVAQGPGGSDKVVAKVGPYGGVWSKPAVWGGNGGYVYLPTASPGATSGGSSGQLNAFRRVVDGTGHVGLSLVAHSPSAFGFSSSSPVVTSDGTTSGSAVVWIVHADNSSGVGATLQAYQAVPQGGLLQRLWSAPLGNPGTGAKFNPPAVDNGRVYVGTRDGTIVGFGARAGAPSLRANLVTFPATSLGSFADASATFTATAQITVNSIAVQNATSAQNPVFVAGATNPALPVTLNAGQQLTVPLTFAPAVLGLQTGTLTANTNAGAVNLPLDGVGVAPTVPISTAPASVNFGTRAIGSAPASTTIAFTNTGSTPFAITGLTAPVGPFTVTGAPATDGSVSVAAGDSIGIGVTFTPPATSGSFTQTFSGQLKLETDVGNVLVPVRGAAAPPAQITISPTSLQFGAVALGQTMTRSFTVGNAGGTPLTILKSKPPVANKFAATTTLGEGTVIPPHTSRIERVRFAPTALGALQDRWIINGNDDTGVQTVRFSGTGVQPATGPPPPPPTSRGYRLVGSDGGIFSFGTARFYGSTGGMNLNRPIVGMAADSKTGGYWMVASDGGVFAFHAPFFGSMGAAHLNAPIVGIAATPNGGGYWMVASDGGIFAFGNARFRGSTGSMHLNAPIVGMAADPATGGYWLVASDGGIFAFGARFFGSTGGRHLNAPIVGMTPMPNGRGYRFVASDGGVFNFGSATAHGSMGGRALAAPVVGISVTRDGRGYWEVGADGAVFHFGDAGFFGQANGGRLRAPIVGISG